MPAVTRQTLKNLAALVWYAGGFALAVKAVGLLREAWVFRPGSPWLFIAVVAGLAAGLLRARYLFGRSVLKNTARIDGLPVPQIWLFFSPRFSAALVLMIAGGVWVTRVAHGHFVLLAVVAALDIALSIALLISGRFHWNGRRARAGC